MNLESNLENQEQISFLERIQVLNYSSRDIVVAELPQVYEDSLSNSAFVHMVSQDDIIVSIYLLHSNISQVEKVQNRSSAAIYTGVIINPESFSERDRPYVNGQYVVIKQYQLQTEKSNFKKELKVLKKIKQKNLPDNAGFPVILSAKVTSTIGEIIMSYRGVDLYRYHNIANSLHDVVKCGKLSKKELSKMAK